MKINKKDEKKYISYEEIHAGECFKCKNSNYIYMKSENIYGKAYDVNLETGLIAPPLDNDTKVTYLPNATVNIKGGE